MSGALWGPPWNLRLVVVDLETCVAPDRHHRIVSLGVAVCRAGGIKQRFAWLVNPGVPVDPVTSGIHGLTDRHLADEPSLDEVLPEFERQLAAKAGETVVLGAHHAAFDVPWLRAEIARVGGSPLPDLPILDTAGSLIGVAGVSVRGRKLDSVLAALGLANLAPHDALGDASATALAACALLERTEARGHSDLPALLRLINAGRVATIKRAARPARVATVAVPVPLAHVESHAAVFPATPSAADLADWQGWIAECARLRCRDLAGRADAILPTRFRPLLLAALTDAAAAGDAAGAATALGALGPLLADLPTSIAAMRGEVPQLRRTTGRGGRRGVAVAVFLWLDALLAPLPRCGADDPCPACRDGRACPRDTWPSALVPAVWGDTDREADAFWNPRGGQAQMSWHKGAGRGYLAMRSSAPRLADAVLRTCYEHWRRQGDALIAAQVADQTWRQAGCRDPFITEARAVMTAAAGRPADLRAALRDCRLVLAHRNGSTDPAWASLAVRAAQIEGRLARQARPAVRRHHPTDPKRPPRPPRFLRTG